MQPIESGYSIGHNSAERCQHCLERPNAVQDTTSPGWHRTSSLAMSGAVAAATTSIIRPAKPTTRSSLPIWTVFVGTQACGTPQAPNCELQPDTAAAATTRMRYEHSHSKHAAATCDKQVPDPLRIPAALSSVFDSSRCSVFETVVPWPSARGADKLLTQCMSVSDARAVIVCVLSAARQPLPAKEPSPTPVACAPASTRSLGDGQVVNVR